MATYKPITVDGEVEDINLVQVEETKQVNEKRILTLPYLNTQIAELTQSIADKQVELATMETLRTKVQAEAEKVELKLKLKSK